MIIPYNCPNCDNEIQVELRGLKRKLVSCTSCNTETQIPDDIGIGPGVIIGNGYKLEKKIGESHLGDIYLALKEDEGRLVRIEILSGSVTSDEESVTRFLQEIELLSSLKHPNLLPAIEAGQDNETYFLVTAHEAGMSLEERLKSGDPLDEKTAINHLISISKVLKYTWDERKLLHRDVKPQNIFITQDGKAKLTGFGIAKSSDGQSLGLTGVGFTIGTPEYMSPEQIRAAEDLDFRSDLYALGVVMYESLVGELPFVEDAPILLMQKHMDEVPIPVCEKNSKISPACSALVDKMLAKGCDERHQSWKELIDEANEVLQSPGKVSKKNTPSPARAQSISPAASEKATVQQQGKPFPIGIVIIAAVGIIIIAVLIIKLLF